MKFRTKPESNGGAGKGLIDATDLFDGCTLFAPNPQHPPSDPEVPVAIAEVIQKWMLSKPARIRETLPIIRNGNMTALYIWWDRAGP